METSIMKRALELFFVFAIVAFLLMTPVAAATDQGLEWGVQNGDRFDFNMHENDDGNVVDEALYMLVDSRPSIADGISNWGAVPGVIIDGFWANGSSMEWSILIFLGIFFVDGEFCFPIGNWTLLSELRTSDPDAAITDSIFFWGFSWRGTFFDPELQVQIGVDYLKSDGFLAHYTVETVNQTSQETIYTASITRQGLFLQDNILLIGGGVVLVLILAIVCMKKKK
jgi:hypothetical protein